MRIPNASKWLVPLALTAISGCSSDDEAPAQGGGGAGTAATTGSGGGGSAGRGGSDGSGSGGSAGTSPGGTAGTAGSSGTATGGTTGAAGSAGAAGDAGSLTFRCADSPPNVTAPAATWTNATGNLAGLASECGNLGLVSANPCSNMVIAGVAQAGLWATEDGGKTWSKLGTGAGSAVITNRISALVYDPAHPGTFWEAGIYNGGGVYKTTDNGRTFEQLGDVTHNDSVSIDFSDPERKTLLAGPHEQTSKLFRSTDGGKTWNEVGRNLPASAGYCTATQVLSATNLLVGCAGGGVFHSSTGNTWTSLGTKGVIPQPLLATDGAIYWPGSQGGLNVSTDQGQHFTETADGNLAPGIVGSLYPAELPDGRIVIIGKDHLQISSDKGRTWKPIGQPLPYPGGGYNGARGPAYSARTKTFYIWRWDCGDEVLPDAIMSAGFDYTKE
jgi:photosystem II stability/assembly factor-like uncharacterized protein